MGLLSYVARGCLGALLVVSASRGVLGQTTSERSTAAGSSATNGVAVGPTSLDVHSDSPEVSVEALRSAIATELGAEVVLQGSERAAAATARVTVSYRPSAHELAVSYSSTTHGTLTRVVEAPATSGEVVATAALLVGNLARDQVATPLPAPALAPAAKAPDAPAPPTTKPAPAAASPPERFANASLFFPLATNFNAPELHTHLSLNLVFGRIGGMQGFELGTVNAVSKEMEGVELGMLGNWTGGSAAGLQAAGVFNVSHDFDGLQVAPFNHAGNVSGAQVGLINIAKKVSGMQLGLINVADEVDGVPIGLVSVTRSGGVHPMIWTSTATYGNVALKFATRYTYTFLSVSMHREDDYTQAGPGLGLGFSIPLAKQAFFEPDISALHLFANTACCRTKFLGARPRRHDQSQFKLRAALRYQAAAHLSVFIGGSVVGNLRYTLDENSNTTYPFSAFLEAFGGLQL